MEETDDFRYIIPRPVLDCFNYWYRHDVSEGFDWQKAVENALHEVEFRFGLQHRQSIEQEIEDGNVRRCSECGKLMCEGYYLDGGYACSDECRNNWYMKHGSAKDIAAAIAEYMEDYDDGNSDYYWTDWEEQGCFFDY